VLGEVPALLQDRADEAPPALLLLAALLVERVAQLLLRDQAQADGHLAEERQGAERLRVERRGLDGARVARLLVAQELALVHLEELAQDLLARLPVELARAREQVVERVVEL